MFKYITSSFHISCLSYLFLSKILWHYVKYLLGFVNSVGVWWVNYYIVIISEMIAYQIIKESKHLIEVSVVSDMLTRSAYYRSHSLTWFVVLLFSVNHSWSTTVVCCHHRVWQIICLYNAWATVVFPQTTLLWLFMQSTVPQSSIIGLLLVPSCVAFLLRSASLLYLTQLGLLAVFFSLSIFTLCCLS